MRVSCQTTARPTGIPVRRSQMTVVSRWFAMPIAAIWFACTPALASACGAMCSRLRQISMASCSTQPGFG